LENRPFNKNTLENYEMAKSNTPQEYQSPVLTSTKKFVASPSLLSKFSPSVTLSKSPCMKARRNSSFTYLNNGDILKLLETDSLEEKKNILMKLSGKDTGNFLDAKNTLNKYAKEEEPVKHVRRKDRKVLNRLSVDFQKNEKSYDEDLPILPAHKYKVELSTKINPVEVEKISKE
jgi:hypothetical protein